MEKYVYAIINVEKGTYDIGDEDNYDIILTTIPKKYWDKNKDKIKDSKDLKSMIARNQISRVLKNYKLCEEFGGEFYGRTENGYSIEQIKKELSVNEFFEFDEDYQKLIEKDYNDE